MHYGFTIDSLIGAGLDYRENYDDLSEERKDFFGDMCEHNHRFQGDCDSQQFVDYRQDALAYAQGAFLMTVVWSQIANVMIRKTQVASIFTWDRMFKNTQMIYAIIAEIVIIVIIVYPGGPGFLVKGDSTFCSVAIWIIPLLLIWDETRKWLCRRDHEGFFFKYTNF
jgi:magnesium-transporting ATPase (P-type)